MQSTTKDESQLILRISTEAKEIVEEAASLCGQTVNDFAISILLRDARRTIQEQNKTVLSHRDRDVFVALLVQKASRPEKALAAAARRYKKQMT